MATTNTADRVPEAWERPTVSVTEAARILGVGRNAAYQAVKSGELPAIVLGRRIVIPVAALRRMLGLGDEPPTQRGP